MAPPSPESSPSEWEWIFCVVILPPALIEIAPPFPKCLPLELEKESRFCVVISPVASREMLPPSPEVEPEVSISLKTISAPTIVKSRPLLN